MINCNLAGNARRSCVHGAVLFVIPLGSLGFVLAEVNGSLSKCCDRSTPVPPQRQWLPLGGSCQKRHFGTFLTERGKVRRMVEKSVLCAETAPLRHQCAHWCHLSRGARLGCGASKSHPRQITSAKTIPSGALWCNEFRPESSRIGCGDSPLNYSLSNFLCTSLPVSFRLRRSRMEKS